MNPLRLASRLLVLAALAAPAPAQFTQFNWVLHDQDGGFGNLSADHMGLHGLFAAFPGSVVAYTTQSAVAGRVSVHALVMPEDGVCGGSQAQYLVDGQASTFATCNFGGDLVFDVAEGQEFGFALQTFDTAWPFSVDLTQFGFLPCWRNLGGALAGGAGTPALAGTGIVKAGEAVGLHLSSAAPSAATTLVVGLHLLAVPFKGGVLLPAPDLVLPGLATDAAGELHLPAVVPAGLDGSSLLLQAWIADAAGPAGLAASNGLLVTVLDWA